MAGLIHIYCGDGKGKTSAALGLALRSAGAGMKVLFVQFLKDGSSSEMSMLEKLGIETACCPGIRKFVFQMSDTERRQAGEEYSRLLSSSLSRCREEGFGLLVLDEVIAACNLGLVPETALVDFLLSRPARLEVVLTGRGPSPALMGLADYVTEMKKLRHPFDLGLQARRGIEF